jgi:hypothetical protein
MIGWPNGLKKVYQVRRPFVGPDEAPLNRLRQSFSRPRLFVASHGYHHGDHEPGTQDSEHNIIEGCHTITAKKKAAR